MEFDEHRVSTILDRSLRTDEKLPRISVEEEDAAADSSAIQLVVNEESESEVAAARSHPSTAHQSTRRYDEEYEEESDGTAYSSDEPKPKAQPYRSATVQGMESPDVLARKLRTHNLNLRTKVKELTEVNNGLLDRLRVAPEVKREQQRQDLDRKAIRKLKKDMEQMKRNHQKLRAAYVHSISGERCNDLENIIVELRREIKTLQDEKKTLEKISRDQDRRLLDPSSEYNYEAQVKTLLEETRVLKARVSQMKAQREIDEKALKSQQLTNDNLLKKTRRIEEMMKAKNFDPKVVVELENTVRVLAEKDQQIKELERKVKIITKAKEADSRLQRLKLSEAQNHARELTKRLEAAEDLIKEKDKEIRLNAHRFANAIAIKPKPVDVSQLKLIPLASLPAPQPALPAVKPNSARVREQQLEMLYSSDSAFEDEAPPDKSSCMLTQQNFDDSDDDEGAAPASQAPPPMLASSSLSRPHSQERTSQRNSSRNAPISSSLDLSSSSDPNQPHVSKSLDFGRRALEERPTSGGVVPVVLSDPRNRDASTSSVAETPVSAGNSPTSHTATTQEMGENDTPTTTNPEPNDTASVPSEAPEASTDTTYPLEIAETSPSVTVAPADITEAPIEASLDSSEVAGEVGVVAPVRSVYDQAVAEAKAGGEARTRHTVVYGGLEMGPDGVVEAEFAHTDAVKADSDINTTTVSAVEGEESEVEIVKRPSGLSDGDLDAMLAQMDEATRVLTAEKLEGTSVKAPAKKSNSREKATRNTSSGGKKAQQKPLTLDDVPVENDVRRMENAYAKNAESTSQRRGSRPRG